MITARPTYTAEELTEASRLLLEIRDNCLMDWSQSGGYDDPKRKEKAKALNLAMDAINIAWNIMQGRGTSKMKINGTAHFESVCKKKLVEWYNTQMRGSGRTTGEQICIEDVFVVWACKTLQNYKALLSTTVNGDGIYAEYTFNGDKGELYEDVYKKLTNTCIKEE